MIEERLRNLVISEFGVKLTKSGDLIEVLDKDGSKKQISPHDLEQVIITGEASITSGVVRLLLEKGVDLVFIGRYPPLFARVVRSDQSFISDIWRAQIMMSDEMKLEIGREILQSAVYNRIRMLQHLSKNREDLTFDDAVRRLKDIRRKMEKAEDSFELFTQGLSTDLMLAGLNPFEGTIHASYRNRPALSFDLTSYSDRRRSSNVRLWERNNTEGSGTGDIL